MRNSNFYDIYERLLKTFGHQEWWPGDSAFEVVAGAVLTQNTNWQNVEKAVSNLREDNSLTPTSIENLEEGRLRELIRPAGYFRQKSSRLKRISKWLIKRGISDQELELLKDLNAGELRTELLSIRGIGPETADSILLYALDKPVFVIDTYTVRIFGRHELILPECGYSEIQDEFEHRLPRDVDLYKDYHAQLVCLGKEFCKKSKPECEECPIRDLVGSPVFL